MDQRTHRPDHHAAPEQEGLHPSPGGQAIVTAWLLSLAFHGLFLGAMLLIVFPFAAAERSADLPVVHAQVVGDVDAAPVAVPTPANLQAGGSPSEGPRFSPDPAAAEIQRVAPKAAETAPDLSVIGIGSASTDAAQLGLALDGGGTGPEFFGVAANAPGARSIVYVVDRSGSMVDTFDRVRAELKRSISALRRSQKFHVIFFNAAQPLENPPMRPVNAIDAHKQQFFNFLDGVSPGGGTKPESAIRRALALEPDILYFLSDGVFDASLVQRLSEWNPQRHTRIYTIAYLDQTGRQLLETIAREHGGEFKFVSEDDLP